MEYKSIKQFEYIIKDKKHELIDNKKLEDNFLQVYNKLGLLTEKNQIND